MNAKEYIAARAAKELRNGDIVNLGIGVPTLVVDYLPKDLEIFIHSENGILGLGPTPSKDNIDPHLVNAGKLPVTIKKGATFFESASSFAMIRGGHIDKSILGALQVNQYGQIANWAIPGESVLGVGGAMDLLEGSKEVIITMPHITKNGETKIVKDLSYPITSKRIVNVIITDMAVFHTNDQGLILVEIAPGFLLKDIETYTDAPFKIASHLSTEIVKETEIL